MEECNNSINMEMPCIAGITAVEQSENFDLEAEIRSVFEDMYDVSDVETAKNSHDDGQDCLDLNGQHMSRHIKKKPSPPLWHNRLDCLLIQSKSGSVTPGTQRKRRPVHHL